MYVKKKEELYIDLYKVLQKVYIFFLIFMWSSLYVVNKLIGSLIIALPVSVVVLEVLTSRMPLLDFFFCILCFYFFSSLMFGTNLERENHFKEVNI